MMKQLQCNVLVLALMITLGLLSGCQQAPRPAETNAPPLTMETASEVNTVSHLLKLYKTITYAQLDYANGDTVHRSFYMDKLGNPCATGDSSGYTDHQTNYLDFYHKESGETVYTLSAMKEAYVSDYLFVVPNGTFISQTTDKQGNLVCVAQADISEEYADQLSEHWKASTADKMMTTTVFASNDFRALSIDFSIRHSDGSEEKIASAVLLYDQEVQHTDAVQRYLNAEKVTVSLQMEDGSMRTAQIPKGETFAWNCDEGYTLYLDKSAKKPLPQQPEPLQADLALYCLPKQ